MNNELVPVEEEKHTLRTIEREQKILEVISIMLSGEAEQDNIRKTVSAQRAMAIAGVPRKQWERWVTEGHVAGPMRNISNQLNQAAYNVILPYFLEMMEVQVSIATGKAPQGSDIKTVRATDASAAFKELQKMMPVEPVNQADGAKSEVEHLETFQPKQMFVVKGDFVYKGGGSENFGDLPSMKNEVEGTAIEVEVE